MDSGLENLLKKIIDFRSKRNWEQFHNPKNLAISISLEAAELLESFQWRDFENSKDFALKNKNKISEEVADLFIYILYLCNDLGIDIINEANKKIEINKKRYPVNKSKGKSNKYNDL